ncbi:MAG TPA: hypothetical protein VMT97_16340 [Terriglobales bacterium]|nr:hypothetical protein [Terriglobales bacterium]
MSTTEYQQLVQFLTTQFEKINRRFDALEEELRSQRREFFERRLKNRIDELDQRLRP